MSRRRKPYPRHFRLFGKVEIHTDRPMYWEDLFGILRNDSVPINDQVIELFKLGLPYDLILYGLGLSDQDLEFDTFMETVGIQTKEEYRKRRIYNDLQRRNRERDKTGWQSNRTKALERDDGKCAICGKKVRLAVHHIHSFSESRSSQLDNLITLCHSHHAQAHRQRTRALLRRRLTSIAGRRNKSHEPRKKPMGRSEIQ